MVILRLFICWHARPYPVVNIIADDPVNNNEAGMAVDTGGRHGRSRAQDVTMRQSNYERDVAAQLRRESDLLLQLTSMREHLTGQ